MKTGHLSDAKPPHLPRTPLNIPERVAERAATRYTVDEEGCWISTYSTGSHGYAQVGWNDGTKVRTTTAHWAAWVYAHGPIPPLATVDHLCKRRRCVRPAHLRLLSNYENARRTWGRDWPEGQCVNGHPNAELIVADGGRRIRCGPCRAESQRRYRAKKKAGVAG